MRTDLGLQGHCRGYIPLKPVYGRHEAIFAGKWPTEY